MSYFRSDAEIELTARGFRLASGNRYDRLIILFPDHFKQCHHAAATTRRGLTPAYTMESSTVATPTMRRPARARVASLRAVSTSGSSGIGRRIIGSGPPGLGSPERPSA